MLHKVKIEFVNGDKQHEYRMGPGPCGHTVTKLTVIHGTHSVVVLQEVEGHSDTADFTYPRHAVKRIAEYQYPEPETCNV